jgi:hypothetical protein
VSNVLSILSIFVFSAFAVGSVWANSNTHTQSTVNDQGFQNSILWHDRICDLFQKNHSFEQTMAILQDLQFNSNLSTELPDLRDLNLWDDIQNTDKGIVFNPDRSRLDLLPYGNRPRMSMYFDYEDEPIELRLNSFRPPNIQSTEDLVFSLELYKIEADNERSRARERILCSKERLVSPEDYLRIIENQQHPMMTRLNFISFEEREFDQIRSHIQGYNTRRGVAEHRIDNENELRFIAERRFEQGGVLGEDPSHIQDVIAIEYGHYLSEELRVFTSFDFGVDIGMGDDITKSALPAEDLRYRLGLDYRDTFTDRGWVLAYSQTSAPQSGRFEIMFKAPWPEPRGRRR